MDYALCDRKCGNTKCKRNTKGTEIPYGKTIASFDDCASHVECEEDKKISPKETVKKVVTFE